MNNKDQNLKNYIEKATQNIDEDRAATKSLLMSLLQYMQTGDDRHREFGLIASKYLETLQRSNEQLVKLASLLQKKEKSNEEMTDDDRRHLFDLIKEEQESE